MAKHHSNNRLVNPVRTNRCNILAAVIVATVLAAPSDAQQVGSRTSVQQSERVARAAWTPIRRSAQQRSTAPPASSQVRLANQQAESSVPLPPQSVMELPIPEGSELPMDGQIILETVPGGTLACDAFPYAGECGCGAEACDGGCDARGCSGFCAGACNGDPSCGELCSPKAWRPCITLCFPQDGWVSLESVGWWQDGVRLPPLLTTSVNPNVPRDDAGVLGVPTTRILYGDESVLDDDAFNGARLQFGFWWDREHTWGVSADYFGFETESTGIALSSTGDPILARPFFNIVTGAEDSELIAYPAVSSGTVAINVDSEFQGAGLQFRRLRNAHKGVSRWLCGDGGTFCSRSEMLFGFRGLQLTEGVMISEDSVSTDPANPGAFQIFDSFKTRNQFSGLDLGWAYKRTRGYWTFDSQVRLALGTTHQTVTIDGRTRITDPGNPPAGNFVGGILAQRTNIGNFDQDEFTAVPELRANLGYQLTDRLRLTAGYTFIYWSNVLRPGDHISRDLNPNLLPPEADPVTGALRPTFAFDTTDYWVQGISFGGEYRW